MPNFHHQAARIFRLLKTPRSVSRRSLPVALGTLGCAALGVLGAQAQESGAGGAAAPAARPRPPLVKSTLSNGLRMFCRRNDASEMISVVCLVQAGLADEADNQAGIAAVTAEALLKGTTTHPGRSFDTQILNAGGNIRTLPGFDFTEISVTASREQIVPVIKLIADVVAHPSFEAAGVTEAKEAVKRTAVTVQDDFTGASYQTLVGLLHPNTPYGRPISGYAQTVDKITPADVRKFWETNYVQNRMVVAIVGDVDAARAMEAAQKAFQDVKFRPNAVTPAPRTENLVRPRSEIIQRPGPAAQIMIGLHAPPATRESYPVYAVLDAIIGGGKRARLFSNIREKHSLGYDLGSFFQPLLYQSHMVGYVVTPPFRRNPRTEMVEGLIEPVRGYLLDQYKELSTAGPTDAELARARNYVIGRYALRQERTRDQAKWLAWNVAMGLGADFDQFFPTRVPLVTKEQVQAAAKKLLASYAVVVTVPEEK